jgi:hypothetical protein
MLDGYYAQKNLDNKILRKKIWKRITGIITVCKPHFASNFQRIIKFIITTEFNSPPGWPSAEASD